jgi:hypothetical protein
MTVNRHPWLTRFELESARRPDQGMLGRVSQDDQGFAA